ncbi:MAG: PadR family transcriptional regulator [Promethearchaeota archaeon]
MVEEYADRFEKAIKKGFTSILILSILEKGPSYGYKIGKEIEELTYSTWEPPASTMYTILKQLSDQTLITTIENGSDERGKKIYEITEKGSDTLKLMRKKQLKIRNALQSFLISTIGEEDVSILREFMELSPDKQNNQNKSSSSGRLSPSPFEGPFAMAFHNNNNITDEQKLDYLKKKKLQFLKKKEFVIKEINQIEKAIIKYENKIKEDINKNE